MKIAGIIAEYNPFHTGHSYHIEKTRELTGADFVIVVMSGDLVQRGGPAFLPKHLRAHMALAGGADLVFELPSVYSCESAEFFSQSGIQLLHSLGCVDFVSFGSECGNLSLMRSLGDFLAREPEAFRLCLQDQLKTGLSYPAARQAALLETWGKDQHTDPAAGKEMVDLLSSPNNILGIEYCKALSRLESSIQPVTVARKGSGYHESQLQESLSSASAIRKHWLSPESSSGSAYLRSNFPETVWPLLEDSSVDRQILTEDDFSMMFRYLLYTESLETLTKIQDVSPDIARRLQKNRDAFTSISQYALMLRSKDITYSRLCRAIFHVIMGIQQIPPVSYARLLGFRRSAAPVLTEIKKKGHIPLLTKPADAPSLLSSHALHTFEKNVQISHVCEAVRCDKYKTSFSNEYTRQMVILP